MKKWLLLSTGVCFVLLAAMPLIIGAGVNYAVNLLLADSKALAAIGLSTSRFERSYATSALHLEFKPLLEEVVQPFKLVVRFKHGPLLGGKDAGLGLLGFNGEITSTPTPQLAGFSAEPLYQMEGAISFTGKAAFNDFYQPLTITLKEVQGQLGRGAGHGQLNWALKRLDYDGQMSQINWQSPQVQVNLADARMAKQVSLNEQGLSWFSRVSYKAFNAQLGTEHYWLQNGALGIARQSVTDRWQLSLVAEEAKSKTLQLHSLDANLALDKVPTPWILGMLGLYSSAPDSPESAQQAQALSRIYLTNPSELVVERVGAVQDGKSFWFSGRAELASLTTLPVDAWRAPDTLLGTLVGTGDIHLEKALVPLWAQAYLAGQSGQGQALSPAHIEVLAKAFAAQGLLTDEGERFSSTIAFKPGAITLNGKPLDLPF